VQSKIWRFVIIAVVVGWAISEWYPPAPGNMLDEFERLASVEKGVNKTNNPEFARILSEARKIKNETNKGQDLLPNQWENVLQSTKLDKFFNAPIKANDVNRVILRRIEQQAAGQINLGLDLKGGIQLVVELDLSKTEDKEGAIEQVISVLRKRVDRVGLTEPEIQRMGENRVSIQLPAMNQAQREEAKNNITSAAFLRFHLVHEDNENMQGLEMEGHTNLLQTFKDQGKTGTNMVLVETEVRMEGKHVARASASRDPTTGAPLINFNLDSKGTKIFYSLTGQYINRRLAVVLVDKVDAAKSRNFDSPAAANVFFNSLPGSRQPKKQTEGNQTVVSWSDQVEEWKLISAPTIQGRIGSRGEITGIDSSAEAREIANVLANPLATPLRIVEERDVDPSLGADSVRQGYQAGLWGVIAVAAFMMGYYLLSGLIANMALALNIVILLGVFCYFDSTLTLPGIAGIVLTIGMAVDANVLIFERIREEQRAGKSLKGAITSGYGKAFGTIFDANVTTIIASLILYYKGHGPVQGFGVTLTIGILASMFTALVVTRLVFDILVDRKWLKSHSKMFALVGDTKIDFLKYAKPAFITSWVIIIIGIGWSTLAGYTGSKDRVEDHIASHPSFIAMPNKASKDKINEALDEKRVELKAKEELKIGRSKEVENQLKERFNKGMGVDFEKQLGRALESDLEIRQLDEEMSILTKYIRSREGLLEKGVKGQLHPSIPYESIPGDTLESIADKFDIQKAILNVQNKSIDWNNLQAGSDVIIPSWLELETVGVRFRAYNSDAKATAGNELTGQKLLTGSWDGPNSWFSKISIDSNGVIAVEEGMFDFALQLTLRPDDPSYMSVCWQALKNNISDNILGIDFAGGKSFVIGYDETNKSKMKELVQQSSQLRDSIAEAVNQLDENKIKVRLNTNLNPKEETNSTEKVYSEFVRVDWRDDSDANRNGENQAPPVERKVEEALRDSLKGEVALDSKRQSAETVGATVSAEITQAAIVATVLALLGILVYVAFRYEFSFAIGAILAIVHDVLMTACIFFIAGDISGIDIASGELNAPIIAAFLTILGFSINDTIVIFDRIRESLQLGVRGSFKDVMNKALNQTLARTVITSGTTLLSTATLYFFGGVVIHDFAFTLLIGVIVGTYSSIYIACAMVHWWHKGKRPEISVPVMDEDAAVAEAT